MSVFAERVYYPSALVAVGQGKIFPLPGSLVLAVTEIDLHACKVP